MAPGGRRLRPILILSLCSAALCVDMLDLAQGGGGAQLHRGGKPKGSRRDPWKESRLRAEGLLSSPPPPPPPQYARGGGKYDKFRAPPAPDFAPGDACKAETLRAALAPTDQPGVWEDQKGQGRAKGKDAACTAFRGVPVFKADARRIFLVNETTEYTKGRLPAKYNVPKCSSQYRRQVYRGAYARFDAAAFMEAAKGKHVVMLGDSLLRQLSISLACHLAARGYKPVNITVSSNKEVTLKYENGFLLSRWSLMLLRDAAQGRVPLQVHQGDVVMASLGRHYRHGHNRTEYADHVRRLVGMLQRYAPSRSIMLESLPGHFPTHSGDLYDPRRDNGLYVKLFKHRRATYMCQPHKDAQSAAWRNDVVHQEAGRAGVPVLRLFDVLAGRHDAHQGWEHFGGLRRKQTCDCVHWCHSKELWNPLLERVRAVVAVLASCADSTPHSARPPRPPPGPPAADTAEGGAAGRGEGGEEDR